MKILFIAHRVPFPPNKGDKIRSFHILQYLNQHHKVHVAVPVDNEDDRAAIRELERLGYRVTYEDISSHGRMVNLAKSAFKGTPLSLANFWSAQLKLKIDELTAKEEFDAAVIFSSSMAIYATDLNIPIKIIDFCDLDSAKFSQYAKFTSFPKSLIYKMEGRRLANYEKSLVPYFDHILFIGPEEKRLFDVNGYDEKIRIMSNGVALALTPQEMNTPDIKTPNIVFTGVMDYLPNVDAVCWFVTHVWKNLRAARPNLSFYIVGKNPVKAVRALHSPQNGVYVTGFVQDVGPYLLHASAFIAPIRIARGMQTKILEAMAHTIPVISSRASARGIGARHGQQLLVADRPDEFETQVSAILEDEKYAQQLCDNALKFIQTKFEWDTNLAIFNELLMKKTTSSNHVTN